MTCPVCQGDLLTTIDNGKVIQHCPNCDTTFYSVQAPEDPETVDDMPGHLDEAPVIIFYNGNGISFKPAIGRRMVELARSNGIPVTEMGTIHKHGCECEAYGIDALADEWRALSEEASQ